MSRVPHLRTHLGAEQREVLLRREHVEEGPRAGRRQAALLEGAQAGEPMYVRKSVSRHRGLCGVLDEVCAAFRFTHSLAYSRYIHISRTYEMEAHLLSSPSSSSVSSVSTFGGMRGFILAMRTWLGVGLGLGSGLGLGLGSGLGVRLG